MAANHNNLSRCCEVAMVDHGIPGIDWGLDVMEAAVGAGNILEAWMGADQDLKDIRVVPALVRIFRFLVHLIFQLRPCSAGIAEVVGAHRHTGDIATAIGFQSIVKLTQTGHIQISASSGCDLPGGSQCRLCGHGRVPVRGIPMWRMDPPVTSAASESNPLRMAVNLSFSSSFHGFPVSTAAS